MSLEVRAPDKGTSQRMFKSSDAFWTDLMPMSNALCKILTQTGRIRSSKRNPASKQEEREIAIFLSSLLYNEILSLAHNSEVELSHKKYSRKRLLSI
jgi:hypothetical protein